MWIKICGIRDRETAGKIAQLKPDAIGLNFYEKTPRAVSIETAVDIVANLPEAIEPVGVFVNHSVEEIRLICGQCRLQTVQLHGDEPPRLLQKLQKFDAKLKILRAYRLGADGFARLDEYLAECETLDSMPSACLINASVDGVYGGTGTTVDWKMVNNEYHRRNWPPLILAGGLTPENVTEAIQTVKPWGVDVAGGVEVSTAVKDLAKVELFIDTARIAAEIDK